MFDELLDLFFGRGNTQRALYELNSKSIDNIVELMSELNLENLHQYFYAFCYLLWNGYFSVDKKYAYNNVDTVDEENTIFLGSGCCRHNARLLEKVLLSSGNLAVNVDICTYKMMVRDLMGINRPIEKNEECRKSSLFEYDHSVVLATSDFDNALFLLDPTVNTECEIIKGNHLVCFGGTYKINKTKLKWEIGRSYITNYSNRSKCSENAQTIKNYYDYAKSICEQNINLIEDFYTVNQPNYEKIKKLVLE